MMGRNPRDLFYHAGGSLSCHAPSYIVRKADNYLAMFLARNFDYYTLIGPRQLGKTSLLNHLEAGLAGDIKLAYVTLESYSTDTEKKWYEKLGNDILRELDYLNQDEKPASPEDGNDWIRFLQQVSDRTQYRGKRLIIVIDEIGHARKFHGCRQMFATLRALYQKNLAITFILAGTCSPNDLIPDGDTSPFNVGKPLDLTDFSKDEVQLLTHQNIWGTSFEDWLADEIFFLTDGHPFLCQCLLSQLEEEMLLNSINPSNEAQLKIAWEVIIQNIQNDPEVMDHAISQLHGLGIRVPGQPHHEDVVQFLLSVLNGRSIMFSKLDVIQHWLWLEGLIKADSNGNVKIRNPIFDWALRRELC